MKNVYLAGKLNSDELSISEFAEELEERGHTVLMKWWETDKLPTPYLDHPETSTPAAKDMIDAVDCSDVTILFPGNTILGAAVEFGAALSSTIHNPDKQIIVVAPQETRQSIFYTHPATIAVEGIHQIRAMDWF